MEYEDDKILKMKNILHLRIWGEVKTVREWSEDERCKVSLTTLSVRVKDKRTGRIKLPLRECMVLPKVEAKSRYRIKYDKKENTTYDLARRWVTDTWGISDHENRRQWIKMANKVRA